MVSAACVVYAVRAAAGYILVAWMRLWQLGALLILWTSRLHASDVELDMSEPLGDNVTTPSFLLKSEELSVPAARNNAPP